MDFELQFPKGEIKRWAERYSKGLKPREKELEEEIADEVASRIKSEGFLSKEDFQKICRWKTRGRTEHWYKENEEGFIKVVTRTAFSTGNERFRIVSLAALKGVDWPTASAILHFGYPDTYPVLDVNALHALGLDEPKRYDYELWQAYTGFCRELVGECKVSMRDLYCALWQYGKEHPRKRKKKKKR